MPGAVPQELRLRAIRLYKELHRLGRDYPDPSYEFNKRLRRVYEKKADITDRKTIEENLALGEHVKKGTHIVPPFPIAG
ncbi:hypothetical protein QFC20_004072 [Naganishia adeliensis]|uniref:Uncharacterized protein n=1 Tax=Naganishia adeliensis TaxID=92952 RepID=A0ACC2W5G8_9TREE|nr:hypothetical protein QFC20_004072 [Naganishia adeliensis]